MKVFMIVVLLFFICLSCRRDDVTDTKNTIFRLGFQTNSFSTGPLQNSGFVIKLNDTIPPLFVTAHHVVAGTGVENQYLKWNEIKDKMKNSRIWSMQDSSYQIQLEENIPIPNAETLKLDIAVFRLPDSNTPYLVPAKQKAYVGDTVQLYSRIVFNGQTKLFNKAIVVFVTDSVLVYELLNYNMARIMAGTSGSAVINTEGRVVANSYGGFTIPNQQEKDKLEKIFPLMKEIPTKDGKTYGVGVPMELIERNIIQVIKKEDK